MQFDREVSVGYARDALACFPGIVLDDDVANGGYPTAIDAAGEDSVYVGRVREDTSRSCGLLYWLACDNLRKGAALNALQILDTCVARGRV